MAKAYAILVEKCGQGSVSALCGLVATLNGIVCRKRPGEMHANVARRLCIRNRRPTNCPIRTFVPQPCISWTRTFCCSCVSGRRSKACATWRRSGCWVWWSVGLPVVRPGVSVRWQTRIVAGIGMVPVRPKPYERKNAVSMTAFDFVIWSGRRDSNPRIPAWEAGALPLGDARISGHYTPLGRVNFGRSIKPQSGVIGAIRPLVPGGRPCVWTFPWGSLRRYPRVAECVFGGVENPWSGACRRRAAAPTRGGVVG